MSGPDGNRPRLRRWDSALTVLVSALVSFVVILGVLELADRAPITDAPEAREPQPERTAADEIARPTPVPPLELHPAGAPIAITVRDAAARTTAGQTVRIPEARLLVELGDEPGEPLLRVRRAVVERPVITMPPGDGEDAPGTTATGGGVAGLAGLDLPYIVVESLVIRGGSLGELARADGGTGWTFLWEDVNLAIRDVVLGGEGARRLAFDLSLDGRVGGQTVRLESVTGAARQGVIPGDTSAVEFDAQVRIGASLVAARGIARPDGTVELEVRADTLDFPGLSGIMAVIPEEGGGAGTIRVVRTPERTVVELMDAAATVAGYRLQARGRAVATEEVIQVDAELTRPAQAGLSRLRVRGTVEPDEIPRLALTVDAVPVILGDSLFTGRLLVTGPTDSITVRGALALNRTGALAVLADTTPPPAVPDSMPSDRQPVIALVDATITGIEDDAPRAEGTIDFIASPGAIGLAAGDPIRAQVEGGAALGPGGELAATVRLDTLPLALIPFPSGIAEVRGHATGGLTVSGTTETPILEGELRVADGEALIVDPGLRITDLQGDLRLADDLVTLGGVTARAGGGDVALEGTVSLDGPLDVGARVDSVRVLDEEDAQLELDAVLALSGTRDAPVVRGRARPSGWIHEAFAESEPGLDLEDPPYAELAARVPWLQRSRLRQDPPPAPSDTATSPVAGDSALGVIAGAAADSLGADTLRTEPTGPPEVDLEVMVDVTPDFRIIDEDSELRGRGPLMIRMAGDELAVDGVVSLEGGFYQSFGARFEIAGGAIRFDGTSTDPRVAVRAVYFDDAPLVGDDESLTAPERFPPIEFFGFGTMSSTIQEMRRTGLFPYGQLDLAGLLLLDDEPQPIPGWRHPRFWRSDEGPELVAERAETQVVPLLWSYLADEAYDYIPLSAGYLRAGVITVGSRYPSRVVIGPVLRAAGVLSPTVELRLSQPFLGSVGPGIAAVYQWRGLWLEAFTEPRFHAAPALGPENPGYRTQRRTGVGIRWSSERQR